MYDYYVHVQCTCIDKRLKKICMHLSMDKYSNIVNNKYCQTLGEFQILLFLF